MSHQRLGSRNCLIVVKAPLFSPEKKNLVHKEEESITTSCRQEQNTTKPTEPTDESQHVSPITAIGGERHPRRWVLPVFEIVVRVLYLVETSDRLCLSCPLGRPFLSVELVVAKHEEQHSSSSMRPKKNDECHDDEDEEDEGGYE